MPDIIARAKLTPTSSLRPALAEAGERCEGTRLEGWSQTRIGRHSTTAARHAIAACLRFSEKRSGRAYLARSCPKALTQFSR